MASAILDSHAFVKRLTAAGMPIEQAKILADEQSRFLGEQLATRQDVALPRADLELLRADMTAMKHRIEDQLTISLGGTLAAAVAIMAAWSSCFGHRTWIGLQSW